MTDKDFAKKQLERLSQLDGYPHGHTEALRELLAALQVPETNQQCEKLVSDWVQNETGCPRPAEIRRLAYSITEPRGKACELCGGVGFLSETRLIQGKRYDYAAPCKCHPARSGQESAA